MATAKSKKNQAQSQLAEVFNMIQAPVVQVASEEESEASGTLETPVASGPAVASPSAMVALSDEFGAIPPLPLRRKRRETRSRKTCLGLRESIYQAMKQFTAENDISLNDLIEVAVVEYMATHKEGI